MEPLIHVHTHSAPLATEIFIENIIRRKAFMCELDYYDNLWSVHWGCLILWPDEGTGTDLT